MKRAGRMGKSKTLGKAREVLAASNNDQAHRRDVLSPEERSALMARIRSRDTGPEMVVRRLLHQMGYRFRLHARDLPGRPDVIFRSRRVAIFIHGCFWHRHDCGLGYMPKTRQQFWKDKFDGNVRRDRKVKSELEAAGWRVIVVWECQIGKPSILAARLAGALGPPSRATGSESWRHGH